MEIAVIIGIIGVLIFLSHLLSEVFRRTKVPDVLSLFLIGLLVGPVFKLVTPADFGAVGPVFTTVTLIVILFESGIGLHIKNLLKTMRPALTLTIVNFLGTVIVAGGVVWAFGEVGPMRSFMLGAIVGGTSSAVVIPLVAQLKIREESRSILVLESALSDVLCIVFALAFLTAHKSGELRVGIVIGQLLSSFLLAGAIGAGAAFLWSIVLNKIRAFRNSVFTTPAFVFVVFAAAELLGFSGAIASLMFGVALGNAEFLRLPVLKRYILPEPLAPNETEKAFFAEVVFLFKTFFFVYIGLSIQFSNPLWLMLGVLVTFLLFVVRIAVVRVSLQRSAPPADLAAMAAIVPKGLAAAVLASVALHEGVAGGEFIQNMTYAVILFSIIATSLLVFLMERPFWSRMYLWLVAPASSARDGADEDYRTADKLDS